MSAGISGKIGTGDAIAASIQSQQADINESVNEDVRIEASRSLTVEEQALNNARIEQEVEKLKEEIKHLTSTREMREGAARSAIALAQFAIGIWAAIFVSVAIANGAMGKPLLSDNALITLTAGATVNVLAAFLGVVRGLFPSGFSNNNE